MKEQIFAFALGSVVEVPGEGTGTITKRTYSDEVGGRPQVQYRVDINDHAKQDKARQKKGADHKGFWYRGDQVQAAVSAK